MLPIEIRERLESISAITIHRLQFTLKVARKKNKSKNPAIPCITGLLLWSHMGSNHGPPDYESGTLTS